MKQLLFLVCIIAQCSLAFGQNSYGKHVYRHNKSECSSGILCVNNPGFLLAGYVKNNNTGQFNLYLDRTDKNGVFNGSPYEFQNAYRIHVDSSCTSAAQYLKKCYGVSAIEQVASGKGYIAVGSTDFGVFFLDINNAGGVNNQQFYSFPKKTNNSVTTALVAESKVFNNEYYITGSYSGHMYILRVSASGALNAAYTMDLSPTYSFCPTAILESPYGNKDVTIIGIKDNGGDVDGFLYQIDNNLTAMTNVYYYNFFAGANNITNTTLHSIAPTAPTNLNNGFILGGYTDGGNTGKAFMMKTNITGVPIWYDAIEGNYVVNTQTVLAVAQRYSAANNVFECYGASSTPAGIAVYKLDDTGIPMSTSYGVNDEFIYNDGTASFTRPVAMSFLNNGAAWDEGLHIYGNMNSTSGGHYLVESYFSGEAGCNNPISTISTANSYTISWCNLSDYSVPPLTPCSNIGVSIQADPNYSFICSPVSSYPSPATNNRSAVVTGIGNEQLSEIQFYPNPTNGNLFLQGISSENNLSISVIDVLGRKIKIAYHVNANNVIEVETKNADLLSGSYFLSVEGPDQNIRTKFYYEGK